MTAAPTPIAFNDVPIKTRLPRQITRKRGVTAHKLFWHYYVLECNVAVDFDYLIYLTTAVRQIDRRNQRIALEHLIRFGVLDTIDAFDRARPNKAFSPDYVDLLILYMHVRHHRPRIVIELGSGVSTAIIARALADNGDGRIIAIEPSAEWRESTAACIPAPLRPCAEVIHREGVRRAIGGQELVVFDDLPDVAPDLVYVDGAPKGAVRAGFETLLAVAQGTQNGFRAIIDGRGTGLAWFARRMAADRRRADIRAEGIFVRDVTHRLEGEIGDFNTFIDIGARDQGEDQAGD